MKMLLMMLFLLAFVIVAGCGGGRQEAGAPSDQSIVVKGILLEEVKERELVDRQEAVGTVKSVTSAVVAARVTGVMTSINVKEGDRVRKGQTLATLESKETSAGAAAARAGADEARNALHEAMSRKRLADATFKRYQQLFIEQAVTRQEFDTRQTEQEVAAQGVARAESRLAQALEGAKAADAMAGYTKVVAPLSGVVTAKSVDSGATLFPGMPILTVEDDSAFLLEVQAPESLKGRISVGQSVDVALDVQQVLAGRVAEVVPIVDPGSRTFTVKMAISGKNLRSGMYGRAMFPVGSRKGITVPRSAVVERGSLTSVWFVDAGGIARMRLIKPGRSTGNGLEVLSGLTAGDRIAVSGVEKLTDGAKIE